MIDTIRISIDSTELPDGYHGFLWNKVTPEIKKEHGYDPNRSIYGHLKNLSVWMGGYGLIIEGSLTKYVLGDNLGSIGVEQIEEAIRSLSDELGIDLSLGKVNRLDIAGNILTKYPVPEYTDVLFSSRYLKKVHLNRNLYFSNKSRCILIYDKLKEMRAKRQRYSGFFKDKNILRYEYRYLQHKVLASFLKIKKVTVGDVVRLYPLLIDEWLNVFTNIKKTPEPLMFKKDAWGIKGEIDRQIKILGINAMGGLNGMFRSIDKAKARRYFKKYPSQPSQLKDKYRGWMESEKMFQTPQIVKELEKKITRVGHYCR